MSGVMALRSTWPEHKNNNHAQWRSMVFAGARQRMLVLEAPHDKPVAETAPHHQQTMKTHEEDA